MNKKHVWSAATWLLLQICSTFQSDLLNKEQNWFERGVVQCAKQENDITEIDIKSKSFVKIFLSPIIK